MGKIKDMTGMRFGRLVVLEFRGLNKEKRATWLCKCDCGNTKVIVGKNIRKGTNSCGCLQKELHYTSHKMTKTRPFKIWCGMKTRCNDENRKSYHNYGGRGITYDDKWENFEGFWEDMGDTYEDGLTLDRIDPNGNYCKENCRWATPEQQANNKRITKYITYNGITKTRSQWCKDLNLNYTTIRYRQDNGWSPAKILGFE